MLFISSGDKAKHDVELRHLTRDASAPEIGRKLGRECFNIRLFLSKRYKYILSVITHNILVLYGVGYYDAYWTGAYDMPLITPIHIIAIFKCVTYYVVYFVLDNGTRKRILNVAFITF